MLIVFITRFIESGCYEGFYERSGKEMIENTMDSSVMPYKIYTKEDFVNSTLKSMFQKL